MNFNYERFYPSSKRGRPFLQKLIIFIISSAIIIYIVVKMFESNKNSNDMIINEKIRSQKTINENLQNGINTLNSEISQLNKKSSELKENIKKLKKEQEDNKNNPELIEVNNKLSGLEKEYNDIEDKTKKMKEEIEKINNDNKKAEEKIKELESKLESLKMEKDKKIKKTSSLADTVILTDDNVKLILNEFEGNLNLNLLYRTSRDGKEISDFNKQVGNHKNLFIVGKTKDNLIIGGYTTSNFEGNGFKEDKYAFLYNINKKQKFKIKKENEALKLKDKAFPSFGDEDMNFAPGEIKSEFPKSYNGNNLELTEGKSQINFEEIEVFYLSKK